jgi:arylsulfatase A-like enzyme
MNSRRSTMYSRMKIQANRGIAVQLLSLCAALLMCTPAGAARPNVVYILADDLGWSDVSAHAGGTLRTPNIDSIFKQGVELRNFMGWCVCSPTRAMFLTGCHPFRVGTGPEVGGELALEETTIGEVFQGAGYRTGVFGKWHNGEDPLTPEFRTEFTRAFADKPNKKPSDGLGANAHGFDEAWVYYGGGADYFTRRIAAGNGPVSWWHNRDLRLTDSGYTEDMITEHALEFIRSSADKPFFCYIPFHLIHAPMQAKEQDLQEVDASITDSKKRVYAAMVQALDKNVGTILKELERLGVRENTIVVFTSDNGATPEGSNLPLRGTKHTTFEGGTRLPTAVHWPKGGLSGGKAWDGLCGACEMLPTLAAMCEIPLPQTRKLDGLNIWPALQKREASPVESYYWAWHNVDTLRTAQWRMHRYFDRVELYDIQSDIGETKNLAGTKPETVKELTAKMDAWVKSLGAALTHQAAPGALDERAAPEGEVLEISVTVTDKAKPKDFVVVPITTVEVFQQATDFIEFDVAVSNATPGKAAWYYSPFKGNSGTPPTLYFRKGEGIDQFGREQSGAPEVRGGLGTWEHRVVGLCGSAPGPLPRQGLVFRGGVPGRMTVYVDNLSVRRGDGTKTSLWAAGKDTRTQKLADTELFKDVQVRVVQARDVHP